MSEQNTKKPNSYEALFALVAFAILGATALLAIGGIYYSFINPSFQSKVVKKPSKLLNFQITNA